MKTSHTKREFDYTGFDLSAPNFTRNVWPKNAPELTVEQQRLADDFMKYWHEVLPKKYNAIERFNHQYPTHILPNKDTFNTLEIGAGIGGHLEFENISNQEYHCVELRENMVDVIKKNYPGVHARLGDCQERLPYEDRYFDRVIAVHVLEHLTDLPKALRETYRVMAPGGILSIVIPCDPGFMYEIARKLSAERLFKKRYNLPYDWFIRREHINSPDEIHGQIASLFNIINKKYFPLMVPSSELNLCLGITAIKE